MAAKNFYETLGVSKNASKDELKKAFYKLAHTYHPDKKGGDEAKFKEVNEAYQTLSDDTKRKQYDTFGQASNGQAGPQGGTGFGGFDFSGFQNGGGFNINMDDIGDIFGDFFGGGGGRSRKPRGEDISVEILLSFEEAVFGTTRKIHLNKVHSCKTCAGSGASKGSKLKTCGTCNGSGKVRDSRMSFFGGAMVRTCETCIGTGKVPEEKCKTCHGAGVERKREEIDIQVPHGIEDGQMLKMQGMGDFVKDGTPGDLYIRIAVQKHAHFARSGDNLVTKLSIKLSDAILGGTHSIESLDGKIELKIPEGTQSGTVIRVPGKGVPRARAKDRGDILITVEVKIPAKLSKKTKEMVEGLREEGL